MLSENFPEVLQTWHDYLQGRDQELHQFSKCIQTKKPLKFAVFDLFGDISAEIWMKQKLHNTSRPSCYKTESFPKNTLLKNSQSWYLLVTSLSTWLSAFNCQFHCLLLLLVKLSCSTHSYWNNFIRSCICINLIERENFMTAFTTQLVLCKLFPDFQWTSFMEIAKQIIGTYKFLHRWTKNFWNNNKFELKLPPPALLPPSPPHLPWWFF